MPASDSKVKYDSSDKTEIQWPYYNGYIINHR